MIGAVATALNGIDTGTAPAIDAVDRRIILATQAGLLRVPRPYHAIAVQVGVSADEVRTT
jgi:DNA-binding Lrp family transcriptional regulator